MERLKMPKIVKVTESITYDVSESMLPNISNLTPRKVYFVRFAGPHGDDSCWIEVNERDFNLAKQIMKNNSKKRLTKIVKAIIIKIKNKMKRK